MSKYVIRNCPAYDYDEEFDYHICKQPLVPYECSVDNCQDYTDCVLKQIYKTCIEYHKNCEIEGNCIDDRTCTICFSSGGNELAQDILRLLQVEEIK